MAWDGRPDLPDNFLGEFSPGAGGLAAMAVEGFLLLRLRL